MNKILLPVVLLLFLPGPVFPQSAKDIQALAKQPKQTRIFPRDYKLLRPRADYRHWYQDYEAYKKYVTPRLLEVQRIWEDDYQGEHLAILNNVAMPHAQLDTTTIIEDANRLQGTWRMVTLRKVMFTDSMLLTENRLARSDSQLYNFSKYRDVFAVFAGADFSLYVQHAGKGKFKKEMSSAYVLENKRYLVLPDYLATDAGVAQVGIDAEGLLFMNFVVVLENGMEGKYFACRDVIEQYIFERVE